MRTGSVKEFAVNDSVKRPAPRLLPWRLIGLVLAFGISGLVWLALFRVVGGLF